MKIRPLRITRLLPAAMLAATAVHLPAIPQTPGDPVRHSLEQAPPGQEEANRQFVTSAIERWAAGGSEFFNEVLSEDVVWTIEGSSQSSGIYRGRSDFVVRAVAPFAIRLSQPIRPVEWQIWADGDHVIINWKGKGVARDGAPYGNTYVWILRMENGKAAEVSAFLDLAPYEDVIQRIPAPASERN
ncbi:nuclear transport factor 2 family protein [Hyphomonas sp. CACIAM 19H1]|uniref:nuclear transport factor 2 family protein n=1 Tax=Hyphomonas sp. CACIAM 19H1 TaxID=1873716 RepID=UPI000DEDC0D6|nr:nuclear transport factor 2 family protein [Hyphomonas sp. CACIAM 19H1]